jgi:hypothetical protein
MNLIRIPDVGPQLLTVELLYKMQDLSSGKRYNKILYFYFPEMELMTNISY